MAGGRPTDYKPEFAEEARLQCEEGATDQELADYFGVSVRSLYRWKNTQPEFRQALKAAKEQADDRVERSLYEKAIGYERDEVDIRIVGSEIVQTPLRKFYPPDTTAAIFWLKNRKPEQWKETKGVEVSGPNGGPVETKGTLDVSGLSVDHLRALASIPLNDG